METTFTLFTEQERSSTRREPTMVTGVRRSSPTPTASGHTSITRCTSGPRDTSPGSACRVIPVQFQGVGLKGTWGNAVLLVGESADRRPPPGNGININTLVNSSEHFIHAVAYATGDASPFRIKFAAVTDSGRAGGPETARDWQRNRRPAGGHTVALGWPRRSGTGVGEWRVPLQNGAGVALDGDGGNYCCCDDPRLRRGRVWLVLANKLLPGQPGHGQQSPTHPPKL